MTKQQRANLYLAGLVIVVLGACVVAIKLTQTAADKQAAEELAEVSENSSSKQNFTFIMPETWKYFKNANTDIQGLLPGQRLQFGIVSDPTQVGVAYFVSTASDPSDETSTLLSVYKYTERDYTFERIYKKSFPQGSIPGIPTPPGELSYALYTFHALAYDDGQLVILSQYVDDSPGPCTEPITLGRSNPVRPIFSLDLADPFHSGLQPYRVPDDVYEAALQRQSDCLVDMGA